MKNKKNIIIILLIVLVLGVISLSIVFQPKFYDVYVNIDINSKYFSKVEGLLVDGLFKDGFLMTTDYTENPSLSKVYGEALVIGNSSDRKMLTSHSSGTTFKRIEKLFSNGNIIDKLLKNKDNIYLCFYDNTKTFDSLDINNNDSCFKVDITLRK